jgi:spermidine synthase
MSETLIDYDRFIFDEMMTHPVLFTHNKAKKVAIVNAADTGIIQEILKHQGIEEICQVNCQQNIKDNPRVTQFTGALSKLPTNTFNIIISLNNKNKSNLDDFYLYLDLLTQDGYLLQESDSLFDIATLKKTFLGMYHAGFHDLQILHFPQPSFRSGSRAAMLGTKHGAFARVREKDVFNKPFTTQYYNFDVHKAALVLPEFIREALAF